MHFEVEHEFEAPWERVVAVLTDSAFQTLLDLPDLSRPEVVSESADGSNRQLRLRYEYIGQLDPIARKIIGGRSLSWIQELRLDAATGNGSLSFSAEADADRLNGMATIAVVPLDDGRRSQRRIAGDFHVHVRLVGGTAERRIVPGLVRRLDVEAEAVANELTTAHESSGGRVTPEVRAAGDSLAREAARFAQMG